MRNMLKLAMWDSYKSEEATCFTGRLSDKTSSPSARRHRIWIAVHILRR